MASGEVTRANTKSMKRSEKQSIPWPHEVAWFKDWGLPKVAGFIHFWAICTVYPRVQGGSFTGSV